MVRASANALDAFVDFDIAPEQSLQELYSTSRSILDCQKFEMLTL